VPGAGDDNLPESVAATKPRSPAAKVPFDSREAVMQIPEWEDRPRYWGIDESDSLTP
jgi:hypothetical protein